MVLRRKAHEAPRHDHGIVSGVFAFQMVQDSIQVHVCIIIGYDEIVRNRRIALVVGQETGQGTGGSFLGAQPAGLGYVPKVVA